MGKQIGNRFLVSLQALTIGHMEQPIEGVHTVVILGVSLPGLLRQRLMKAGRVFQIEALHVGHLQQAVIIDAHRVIPDAGAALLHSSGNGINVNDLVADIAHKPGQDHFIDAGEAFRFQQIRERQLIKTVRQLKLFLHLTGDSIEALFFI